MITIIPAIDVIDGQCVRLTRGAFDSKKVYDSNPVHVARQFEEAGIKRLHMVDLDGARKKQIVNWRVLQSVAEGTNLQIDFGGGVQSDEDIKRAFECGARQITAGSIAVKNKALVQSWLQRFGNDKLILGSDVRDGKIAVSGWQNTTEIKLIDFLKEYRELGFKETICTDIAFDGTLEGPAFELYKTIKSEIPDLKLIASGGVCQIDDVAQLNEAGIDGVIIGKAIYEGRIKLEELKPFLC